MIRRWVKNAQAIECKRKCVRYDFGDYEGWLDGDTWRCWQILSTKQSGDEIIQILKEMPDDFCPFKAYYVETLHIEGTLDEIQTPLWSSTTRLP